MSTAELKQIGKRLLSLLYTHRQGPMPDIFIFSSQRSGSTLLFDMVAAQPGFKAVGEPFQERKQEAMARYMRQVYSRFVESGDEQLYRGIEAYITDLLAGSFVDGFERTYNWRNPRHHFTSERNVVKILRANHLIPWFFHTFPGRYVLLLRHPVPTALSRTRNGWSAPIGAYTAQSVWFNALNSAQKGVVQSALQESLFRQHILVWCLEHVGVLPRLEALQQEQGDVSAAAVVPVLHYESLLLDSQRLLPLLTSAWELPDPEIFYSRFSVPSRSSRYSVDATKAAIDQRDTQELLSRWQGSVDAADIRFAQQVLDVFEISFYRADQPLPVEKSKLTL